MSIEVPTTTNNGGIYTGKAPTTAPKQTMDSEVFMKLLVAQLKNQDPALFKNLYKQKFGVDYNE